MTDAERDELAREWRAERDRRIAACSWRLERWAWRNEPVPPAWAEYVQALRDISKQATWPETVRWPNKPDEPV
jgi:hypothetical protein